MTLEPGLYVAATPIGNLGDVTYRVIETLKQADLILCEDTRQTARLCQAYGITTKRSPYHDHNGALVRPAILDALQQGQSICLVSDAGTPLISDPGYKLVAAAREAEITVTCLPGPCAAIAALSIAGLPSNQFHFAGFPPAKSQARLRFLEDLKAINTTLIFYESASRMADSLHAMAKILGPRQVIVARELTKKFETINAGQLDNLDALLPCLTQKGEVVILIGPQPPQTLGQDAIDALLHKALETLSVKEAARQISQETGISRRDVYNRALKLKGI